MSENFGSSSLEMIQFWQNSDNANTYQQIQKYYFLVVVITKHSAASGAILITFETFTLMKFTLNRKGIVNYCEAK